MRKLWTAAALTIAAVLVIAGAAFTSPSNDDELLKDEQHFLQQMNKTYTGGEKAAQMHNMSVVGHTDLGGRGFNADVWEHEGFAYVGHWGFTDWSSGTKQRFCPSGDKAGVAVVDARNPENPRMISRLVNPPGTSAEDVVVYTARFGKWAGKDIAAAGIQVCGGSRYDDSIPRGLMLWNVTNPAAPKELGFLSFGCCTRGLHEFEIEHRADLGKTFAYATDPTAEEPDAVSPSGREDQAGRGPFRLIDITNPMMPTLTSHWGFLSRGVTPAAGQGCDADGLYGHGVEPSHNGKLAFLAYWDSGYPALDLTNPASPVFLGRAVFPANADGDAHSSMYDDDRKLLFSADEDFCRNSGPGIEKGNGYMRVWDFANPAAPVQIGEFRTPNSITGGPTGSGDYTIHNNWLVGTDVWVSWYSDGVRVVDASDPTAPEEVAFFVPPAGQNPVKPAQRGVLSQMPQVWGIVTDEETGYGYASDMNTGLWIIERTDD